MEGNYNPTLGETSLLIYRIRNTLKIVRCGRSHRRQNLGAIPKQQSLERGIDRDYL